MKTFVKFFLIVTLFTLTLSETFAEGLVYVDLQRAVFELSDDPAKCRYDVFGKFEESALQAMSYKDFMSECCMMWLFHTFFLPPILSCKVFPPSTVNLILIFNFINIVVYGYD